MRVVNVTIGTNKYYLARDEDVDAVKAQVVEASRAHGDFVDFNLTGDRCISVLITGASTVTFELIDANEDDIEEGGPESGHLHIDGDYWID